MIAPPLTNHWSASALAAAFLGARRFTDMLTMMGAPPAIVSDRLRTFCRMGVLETRLTSAGSQIQVGGEPPKSAAQPPRHTAGPREP